jgi:hypothetical protein
MALRYFCGSQRMKLTTVLAVGCLPMDTLGSQARENHRVGRAVDWFQNKQDWQPQGVDSRDSRVESLNQGE